jgi:Asp-tRNA(Asn)/Glu-tRNA(Gln) amidotransferase A subunit family amidase
VEGPAVASSAGLRDYSERLECAMSKSRREFLTNGSLGLLGVAVTACNHDQQRVAEIPPGTPPAFATAPAVGPEVSPLTFAEAEKLVQIELSESERKQAVASWRNGMAPLYERRVGPRKVALEPALAPWAHCQAALPGQPAGPERNLFVRSKVDPGPLPSNDEDIAFAPVTRLSRWIEKRQLTSERLTNLYLERIDRFNPTLRCVITPTRELALAQAKQADKEIAAGHYRGPLHGIPWGGKDLLDTAGIPTTYGAEPFRNRVPAEDAAGRVPRTGAMTLCWSLDKLGPMTRGVEDTLLVLNAITGPDPGDVSSVPSKLDYDAAAKVQGLRVGYFSKWMKEAPATEVDRAALETVKKLGMIPVEVSIPDWPYDSLQLILFAEAAASFEELTLTHGVDQLKMQVPDAWPNTFRQSRFLSAVDFVQADRFRRKVANEMGRVFSQVDLLLVPSLRDEMLTITNATGHPSLTLRAGFIEVSEERSDWAPDPAHPPAKFSPPKRVPHGVTLIGGLFDEGRMASAGLALERSFGVADQRPPGF